MELPGFVLPVDIPKARAMFASISRAVKPLRSLLKEAYSRHLVIALTLMYNNYFIDAMINTSSLNLGDKRKCRPVFKTNRFRDSFITFNPL